MYSTPIHAVPKPHSEKLWLVNNHSAGHFSLNSMIMHEDVLGAIIKYWRHFSNTMLVIFKSDVSAACWSLPLHPLWQIKQIVTVDNSRHVDWCTRFGGRGSCWDYTAFMRLVLWITIFVKFISDLFRYIDDNCGFDKEGNILWYEPYRCYYPIMQTKLLKLWDEISLPHFSSWKREAGIQTCTVHYRLQCGP